MIIVIFGPEASGKMTIGKELEKYNMKLLYNHQIIDLVGAVFNNKNVGTLWEFELQHIELISDLYEKFIRFSIDNNENLVFTITWNFDNPCIKEFFLKLQDYANRKNTKMLFVELYSSMEERLKRNKSISRLESKVCKRDVEKSDMALVDATHSFRLNSNGEMKDFEHYLYFDNTNMQPSDVVNQIIPYILQNM